MGGKNGGNCGNMKQIASTGSEQSESSAYFKPVSISVLSCVWRKGRGCNASDGRRSVPKSGTCHKSLRFQNRARGYSREDPIQCCLLNFVEGHDLSPHLFLVYIPIDSSFLSSPLLLVSYHGSLLVTQQSHGLPPRLAKMSSPP